MGYGVMRCEKRKRDAIGGIQKENCRTKEQHEQGLELDNSEIDWERTAYNNYLIQNENWHHTVTDRLKEIEKETGKKTRKDAVTMIDTLFSASREFFDLPPYDENNREEYLTALRDKLAGMTPEERQAYFDSCNKYFEECLDFYVKEFCQGDRSRVISAVVHYDEATPHLHVTSVPILTTETGDRLNAKVIMGGVSDYRHHQDRFFSEVSSRYGLERGETRAPAEAKVHTTKKEWQIAQQEEAIGKNNDVIQRQHGVLQQQFERYTAANKAIEEQGRILQDTKDKIETLSNEALKNIKVNKAADLFNKDTVTLDRKSYDSLTEAVKAMSKEAGTIAAAKNISQKKAELTAVTTQIAAAKRELAEAEYDRDSVQAEYEAMRSYIDNNRSGLQLRIENATLKTENQQLKQENSLLKKAVGAINKFVQEHPALVPDFIRKELAKLSTPAREIHRGHSI